MINQRVRLESKRITDWDSFHSVFAEALGFPDFYGRNMNAWIDCMSYLDDAGAGMTHITVSPGELFHLEIADAKDFQRRLPEIFQAFIECAAFVNHRRTDAGELPVLSLVLL
jgi:RNAse (barnase) inhibitor barstar